MSDGDLKIMLSRKVSGRSLRDNDIVAEREKPRQNREEVNFANKAEIKPLRRFGIGLKFFDAVKRERE